MQIARGDINKNISVKLYEDVTLLPDKMLGQSEFSIKDCFDKPGTWAINDLFGLTYPKNGMEVGKIYLMF